jgi:hypothetical protein
MTTPPPPENELKAQLLNDLWLGLKMLLASGALAYTIKFLGPKVAISHSTVVVLGIVLVPSLGIGLIFGVRQWQNR